MLRVLGERKASLRVDRGNVESGIGAGCGVQRPHGGVGAGDPRADGEGRAAGEAGSARTGREFPGIAVCLRRDESLR